ncbi:hypothetical protein [Enterobacter quasihormaechei]|uniref:hypothetical protein n=1 Tax=Enterobacter quasihormaechei TaxID=2529382 RepID=UPI003D7000F4
MEVINSPDQHPTMRIMITEECIRLNEVDWRKSEYDIVLKIVNEKTAIRYAAQLILTKGISSELLLTASE